MVLTLSRGRAAAAALLFALLLGASVTVEAQQGVRIVSLSLPTRTLTAVTDNATLTNVEGFATASVTVVETGDQVLTAYCRNDGTNWVAKSVIINAADGTPSATITGSGQYAVDINGCKSFKVEVTTDTSGSSAVTLIATQIPLASGASGTVVVSGGTIEVENIAVDSTVGQDAINTGPQGVGRCDTTNPTAVTDGQAQHVRVDCTTGATLAKISTAANNNAVIACDNVAVINTAAGGNVELVALTSTAVIYVCSYTITAEATVDVRLVTGTGSACATDETSITGLYALSTTTGVLGISRGAGLGMITKGAVSSALCIETSDTVQMNGEVTYTKFIP